AGLQRLATAGHLADPYLVAAYRAWRGPSRARILSRGVSRFPGHRLAARRCRMAALLHSAPNCAPRAHAAAFPTPPDVIASPSPPGDGWVDSRRAPWPPTRTVYRPGRARARGPGHLGATVHATT